MLVHRFGSLGGATASLDGWRGAALYGSELALVAIKWFWIAMAPLLLAWVVTGGYVQYSERRPRGYEGGASIATGRLGIGVSLCAFVVMTMALWALLGNLLDLALKGVGYLPEIFSPPMPMPGQSSAQAYLHERYLGSTETFAPLAILLLTLLGFALVTLFPSVLAELTVIRDKELRAGAAGAPRSSGPRSGGDISSPRRSASAAG